MTDAVLQRDIGRLEGEVKSLVRTVEQLTEKLEETNKQVGEISTTLAEARGGWRTLVWLAGAAAAAGAVISQVIQYLASR